VSLEPLLDKLFVLLQQLLPERLLGRGVYALTRNRNPWLRTFLIRTFVRVYGVNLAEVEHPEPEAWVDVNAFFTRPLRPGARPVASRPEAFVSPADGTLEEVGYATDGHLIQAKRFSYPLAGLLATDAAGVAPFRGGATATIYLAPRDYHRVHMPFGGRVREMVYVPGRRLAVNRRTVRTVAGLFAANERVILQCESPGGRFAVVLVGALNVASISLAWRGEVPASNGVQRERYAADDPRVAIPAGGLLGQFNLGSTVVVIAEQGLVTWDAGLPVGGPVRMGEQLGLAGPA
jgi:phosphatidylserine decarboxylase